MRLTLGVVGRRGALVLVVLLAPVITLTVVALLVAAARRKPVGFGFRRKRGAMGGNRLASNAAVCAVSSAAPMELAANAAPMQAPPPCTLSASPLAAVGWRHGRAARTNQALRLVVLGAPADHKVRSFNEQLHGTTTMTHTKQCSMRLGEGRACAHRSSTPLPNRFLPRILGPLAVLLAVAAGAILARRHDAARRPHEALVAVVFAAPAVSLPIICVLVLAASAILAGGDNTAISTNDGGALVGVVLGAPAPSSQVIAGGAEQSGEQS